MAATTMNISLTPELRREVEKRVRTGRYGNASDVVRAGLRALDREEMGAAWREWQEAKKALPQDTITPENEAHVVEIVRRTRRQLSLKTQPAVHSKTTRSR